MEFRLWTLGFMEFFAKQQSSSSWENEMNRKSKKYRQKTVGILLESLRVVVSVGVCERVWVCTYACVDYSCVSMCVCMGLFKWRHKRSELL